MSQGFVNQGPIYTGYTPPTVQTFTSGSGTYTKPAGVLYLRVRMVGGGGGGGGSSTDNTSGAGGTGGSTTFGSSLLTCTGGGGGSGTTGGEGGAGGTATLNSPAYGTATTGSTGSGKLEAEGVLTTYLFNGGAGGQSAFFGGGIGDRALGNLAGNSAPANSGSGGGGASNPAAGGAQSGAGGGAGASIDAIIPSPSATYAYAIGAAGTAGAAGTGGQNGGAGGSGYIEVTEYYQLNTYGELLTFTGTGNTVNTQSPDISQPNLIGTTTNDNAAAGSVGEYISSTVLVGSAVSLTTSTTTNVTSISLTAGDWDVWGVINYALAAGTTITTLTGSINTVSATNPTVPGFGSYVLDVWRSGSEIVGASNLIRPLGTSRISLASTTTVYLLARAAFTVSTMTAYGLIGARRVR